MKYCSGFLFILMLVFAACSTQRTISSQSKQSLLDDSTLQHAHVGISIFDPSTNKYLYDYQGDHYFTPASNAKLPTTFAALKYLGDSITGINYLMNDTAVFILPTGDPTLLHPSFKQQPVMDFLQQQTGKSVYVSDITWQSTQWGNGWSWSDYSEYYMAERSPMPVYGNYIQWVQENKDTVINPDGAFVPSPTIYSIPEVEWKVRFNPDTSSKQFHVQRNLNENVFVITQGVEKKKDQWVPFLTNGLQATTELLSTATEKRVEIANWRQHRIMRSPTAVWKSIRSQPLDSVLKPLLYSSDNFLAEQILLMVSNEVLGMLNDKKLIDTLLKTDFADLPQPIRWADGSGLSRYNLFTPQSIVAILQKMEKQVGMERLKKILPSGGQGTLRNYYLQDSGYVYAKTGTLSGVLCLSGFLQTRSNKHLIFSVLINNHIGDAPALRRKVEALLQRVRNEQ